MNCKDLSLSLRAEQLHLGIQHVIWTSNLKSVHNPALF